MSKVIYIGYVTVSLLGDFLGAYCETLLDFVKILKTIYAAVERILTDIKFWLVFCIATLLFIFPFAYLLERNAEIEASKIDVHVLLSDGRVFDIKKSEIRFGDDSIEFTTNDGETIKTTLFTISYKKVVDKNEEQ